MAKKIAVIDAETDPFEYGLVPKPFLWGFYDGIKYKEFKTTEQLINFLKDKPLIVYAHNGGKFDYHFLLDQIALYDELMIINGRLSKFKIGKCEFRDSYNIIPIPLATYQKTVIDYEIFKKENRNKKKNKQLISDYLKDDCVFLYQLVKAFVDRFGVNLTVASTAIKQWRKISGIKIQYDDGSLFDKFRPYYFGGRCEAFTKGIIDKELVMIDINSAYPRAMLERHAFGLGYGSISENDFLLLGDKEKGRVFIHGCFKSTGFFPYRVRDGSLTFPNDGEYRDFYLTGWEWLAAIRCNALQVKEIYVIYDFYDSLDFTDYVNVFYAEKLQAKKEGDLLNEIFSKLMLNSLYGKWATNSSKHRDYVVGDFDLIDENGCSVEDFVYSGDFGERVLLSRPIDEDRMKFYNIATASSITGYVRAFMAESMHQCKGVVYCDTDSICCESIGDLVMGDDLGQWGYDGYFSGGAIGGKKLYAFKHKEKDKYKTASKGVRLTPHEIYEVAKGGAVTYKSDSPTFSLKKEVYFQTRKIKLT